MFNEDFILFLISFHFIRFQEKFQKAKEKKKKKKEEKALEKKKKKERKEKEKREKELRKEQDRARKLLDSNVDRESADNIEQSHPNDHLHESKKQDGFDANIDSISKELYDDAPNTPEKQVTTHEQITENIHITKMDDFDIDEGDDAAAKSEILDLQTSAPTKKETIRPDDRDSLDLYGDIVGDELDMTYPDEDVNLRRGDDGSPTNPGALNRSDSILDIHANLDFEHEMDEIEPEVKKSAAGFLPFPELSKWERDDEMYLYADKKSGSDTSPYDEKGKVTNEVIKRAENAIFTRAINAIRPIEIKKISTDRQKLYANEKRENSPNTIGIVDDIQNNMKITVPVFTNEERSVELKSDTKIIERARTKTPVRSIKDRLGSKVHNSPRSRTRTPPRKVLVDNGHSDKDRSRDRNKRDDRARDGEKRVSSRTNDARRVHDTKRVGLGVSKDKEDRRERDKEDRREPDNRSRDRQQRERERQMKTDREKDREKEKERARQMARAREMERIKEMTRKQMDKEKVDKRDGKRDRSVSVELKHRREQGKDEKKPKLEFERVSSKHISERKRTSIDESKFVPDYDEGDKKIEAIRRKQPAEKPVEIKHKEQEKRKSRSNSESSSSASDSDSSDSSSDSDDKKRKKRKHKKQKRSKRASSSESDASSKKKKSKHKKSKKKKKGKGK